MCFFMTGFCRHLWRIKTWIVISVQVLIFDQAVVSVFLQRERPETHTPSTLKIPFTYPLIRPMNM